VNSKNILLLEDQLTTQEWIASILQEVFPHHTIFKSSSAEQARQLIDCNVFSIAIIKTRLVDDAGISLLKAIKTINPASVCVVSSETSQDQQIFSALQSGADGYIINDGSRINFQNSLQHIHNSEPALSASVVLSMMHYIQQLRPAVEIKKLTPRQSQILALIAQGQANKQIAIELDLSIYTIMDHIKRLYEKLNISSRAQAAIKAHQLGLIK